ncbi:MAG: hypothetical protein ACE5FG_03405 [Myxococcota bacterium]
MPRSSACTSLLAFCLLCVTLASAPTAQADPTQLCRSLTTIAFAPTDVVLGPVIAAKDLHYGITEWGDPLLLQIVSIVPGYVYLNAMQAGGGILRVIGGVLEFPMGLFTLFREGAQGALFRSQDEAWALVSEDIGYCPIRIGTSYNSINL